jgi:hypothetical protein
MYINETGLEHLWDKIKSLVSSSSGGVTPADYVVETGTEVKGDCNPWYWEKWNSGKAVAWCHSSVGSTSQGGTLNSWKYRKVTYNFPTGLFTAAPMTLVNAKWGTGYSWGTSREITATSFAATYFANGAGELDFSFYAVGRWK